MKFLGHKIRDNKLMIDQAKVQAIQDYKPPVKVFDLRLFLGLVNYYQWFIKGYFVIASPLTNLNKKNQT